MTNWYLVSIRNNFSKRHKAKFIHIIKATLGYTGITTQEGQSTTASSAHGQPEDKHALLIDKSNSDDNDEL